MTRLRLTLAASAAFTLALGATVIALSLAEADVQSQPRPSLAVPVRVEAVHLRPAAQTARYAAVIAPRIESTVGFRVTGKLTERLVDVGARVEAGTVLARLDQADLQLQVRQTEARLAAAKSANLDAQRNFARYAKLNDGGWTTQQESDKRKSAADSAAATVAQLVAELTVSRDEAAYASLTADSPGVVTAVLAEPGQVVSAGQGVLKIARTGELEAVADLPETALGEIRNAELSVELWSAPGISIPVHLREVAASADSATRTFRVKVSLANPPPGAEIGMTATLVARQAGDGDVALLPLTAIAKIGDRPGVFVLNAARDGVALRPVQILAYSGDRAVVAGGLGEGDSVVTAGVQKLDPGQKVRVWTEPAR